MLQARVIRKPNEASLEMGRVVPRPAPSGEGEVELCPPRMQPRSPLLGRLHAARKFVWGTVLGLVSLLLDLLLSVVALLALSFMPFILFFFLLPLMLLLGLVSWGLGKALTGLL